MKYNTPEQTKAIYVKMCQNSTNEQLVEYCEKLAHLEKSLLYDAAFETLRERDYFM